jgi:hypothetical protein
MRHGAAIYDEAPHDPYAIKGKYAEPTVCSDCRAVYVHGRWQWGEAPPDAREALCPACHRIRDRLPAGEVQLSSAFVDVHRDKLVAIAWHEEAHEKSERPLNRIMGIEHGKGSMKVTTTDIHLPRRIAETVKRAYRGTVELQYAKNEYGLRAEWRR